MKINIINDSNLDTRGMDPLVTSLCGHAQDVLGYSAHPNIRFVSDPKNYGMMAKTAEYDPTNMTVSVYVDGRHPKDILRSIAHELVHHHQNERGELSGGHSGPGYAQKDPHMRDMEAKAYLHGNLDVFRDWEDRIKQDNPSIYNERRTRNMSKTIKEWKQKELNKLLMEKCGLGKKKDSKKESEEKLNENDEKK